MTGAYSRVGINRQDGIVYFLHRRSPEKGAEILWGDTPKPDPAALPKLRSSSDLAFGLWNRVPAPDGQKIEMFMSVNIVNEDAEEIIKRALDTIDADEVRGWPGVDFDMATDAGKALLGNLHIHECVQAVLTDSRFSKRPGSCLLSPSASQAARQRQVDFQGQACHLRGWWRRSVHDLLCWVCAYRP